MPVEAGAPVGISIVPSPLFTCVCVCVRNGSLAKSKRHVYFSVVNISLEVAGMGSVSRLTKYVRTEVCDHRFTVGIHSLLRARTSDFMVWPSNDPSTNYVFRFSV